MLTELELLSLLDRNSCLFAALLLFGSLTLHILTFLGEPPPFVFLKSHLSELAESGFVTSAIAEGVPSSTMLVLVCARSARGVAKRRLIWADAT